MNKSIRTETEILRYSPDIVFITEPDGRILFANDHAQQVLGYSLQELKSFTLSDILTGDSRETFRQQLSRIIADGQRHIIDVRLSAKSRQPTPVELSILMMPNGQLFAVCRDIAGRKQSVVYNAETSKQFSALLKVIPDPIFFKDGEGHWLIINEPAKQLFRLHGIDWYGKTDKELAELNPELRAAHEVFLQGDEKAWQLKDLLITDELIPLPDGGAVTMEVLKMPTFEADGQRKGMVIIGRDITERKQSHQRINELAFYDPLTKLPNRRLLLDRLRHASAASANSKKYGAVFYLNLDHFKAFNSGIGDLLLHKITRRLNASVQEGDTVACLGGDVFVIVMEALNENLKTAAEQAQRAAEKIRSVINQPHILNGQTIRITASIGITMFFGHQETSEGILKRAKSAMVQAKAAGRDAIHFYNHEIQATLNRSSKLEQELRLAIENRQFQLHYQVQVDNQSRALGAEVLLRWLHPERGLVAPTEYIATCEDTGLIISLGLWVLEQTCRQLKTWEEDILLRDLILAVNVSAKQFHQENFVANVHRILLTTGINVSRLKMELTESSVMGDVEDTIVKMRELKSLGINFSLDDFGTGHSSLQYLKRLPFDQIKIDQSFVCDIATDPNDAAIVNAIISMSGALGLSVIAEGVESKEQRNFLDRHGCHVFQGYLFGEPLPLAEFEKSLHQREIRNTTS